MVDPSAIADLERAAANLDRLLRGWTEARVAETESTPSVPSKPESLSTINAGIQSLWRLVAIHKSIEQLKNPPAPADRPSLKNQPPSRDAQAPQDAQAPLDPHPIASTCVPAAPQTPYVPYVPSVPLVPSLGSLDEIIAKTDQVYAEVTALCEASGIPVPDPVSAPAAAADQLSLNFIDALSRRAKYPGSGRLLDSIRNDHATPP